MRISDWSSDVCSSDLGQPRRLPCSIAGNRRDLSPINGPQFSRDGGNSGRRPRRGSGVNRDRNDGGCSAPGGDLSIQTRIDVAAAAATENGTAPCRDRGGQYV